MPVEIRCADAGTHVGDITGDTGVGSLPRISVPHPSTATVFIGPDGLQCRGTSQPASRRVAPQSGSRDGPVAAEASASIPVVPAGDTDEGSPQQSPPDLCRPTPSGPLRVVEPKTPPLTPPVPPPPPPPPPVEVSAAASAARLPRPRSARRRRATTSPKGDAGLVCPACLSKIALADLETLGCGAHPCCSKCAAQSARAQVRSGRLPRCFHPECRAEIDPLVALRLLAPEDRDIYLGLALWSNPRVEACPRCCVLVYSDLPASCSTRQCPACLHKFCAECRGPAHGKIPCDLAAQQLHTQQQLQWQLQQISQPQQSQHWCHQQLTAGDLNTVCDPEAAPLVTDADAFRPCPRCRMLVEKVDDGACDHMICARCRHEFCWSCGADRAVIYAHGNHHHRPSCKFYSPFSGSDDYLPDRCVRCALRGSACRAAPDYRRAATQPVGGAARCKPQQQQHVFSLIGEHSAALVETCVRWFRSTAEATSCTMVHRPPEPDITFVQ